MKKFGIAVVVFLLASLRVTAQTTAPYVDLIDQIPDLIQTDTRADLPDGGKAYCAPVTVSNSLMWFGLHGFPRLLPPADDAFSAQATIARILGSQACMNVDLDTGTSPYAVIKGVNRYIRECGYSVVQLQYQGWRTVAPAYRTGITVPELQWLQTSLRRQASVWLNVGWYKYDAEQDQFMRSGGHWVTLVGFGRNEQGEPDPNVLIVHDPVARKIKTFPNSYVTLTVLRSGVLAGKQKELPRSATGYFKLDGLSSASTAILDGAVVLRLGGR